MPSNFRTVAALLTSTLLFGCSSEGSSPAETTQNVASEATTPVGVTTALARLSTTPRPELDAGGVTQFGDDIEESIPAGSRVTAVPGSWSPDGPDSGVVTAEVLRPSGQRQRYQVVMKHEQEQWRPHATGDSE